VTKYDALEMGVTQEDAKKLDSMVREMVLPEPEENLEPRETFYRHGVRAE
jgi:hypothetical protein